LTAEGIHDHSGLDSFTSRIIEKVSGPLSADEFTDKETFDVLVIGGGPAGASSAIYAARKGIKTGIR
jgi:alkyl hydroperoxide reductase subunit F